MSNEEKDKYDEIDELEDVSAQLEGVPGEAEAGDKNIAQKIEDAAKVRDAAQYLRGHRQVKVIKKSAIKAIVDSIIKSYGGMEQKELLSKIAEYEFSISNLKQDKQSLADQLGQMHGDQQALQDEVAIKYEKELEEMRARLANAEKLLSQEVSAEKVAQLEEEVLRLRARVEELERGLELAVVVEEFDYGMMIEAAIEHKQKAAEITADLDKALEAEPGKRELQDLKNLLEAIDARLEFLRGLFEQWRSVYAELFKKVKEKEGSVSVIAELVRLDARNRGLSREIEFCGKFLETAQVAARGR